MKVLMTTNPGLGHLHPMIPVSRALVEAGHEVAFASSASFCPYVEKHGFRAFAVGLDWLESRAEEAFPQLAKVPLENNHNFFLTDVFADIAPHRMIPDLLEVCRSFRPDVLVRNDYEFSACVVGEVLGLPHATVSIEMFLPSHWWRSRIGEQMAYLRSAYRLPPYPSHDTFNPYLYLTFLPPGFQSSDIALPPHVHSLRPVIVDGSSVEQLPAWVERLPSRPTVYATLGTVFNRRPGVFQSIIDALGDEPINLIMTLGWEQDPEQFGPTPENVYLARYIPQSLLLPHCDLAITHAGFGTTLAVLTQGLPMLAVPVSATDPFRAMRCVELELGLALSVSGSAFDDEFQFPELNADSVRAAVRELLESPRYRGNARTFREQAMSLPGPERAVELLEQLATRRAQARA